MTSEFTTNMINTLMKSAANFVAILFILGIFEVYKLISCFITKKNTLKIDDDVQLEDK